MVTATKKSSYADNEKLIILAKGGDEQARETLLTKNQKLCGYIAGKFQSTGVDTDDLASYGKVGLIKAYNTYNIDSGIKFATYASRCITNEILMFLRRNKRHSEVASTNEVLNIDMDGNQLTIEDIYQVEESGYATLENSAFTKDIIDAFLNVATDKEKLIFFSTIYTEQKVVQKEIASKLNLSQSYISRLEKKIIEKLKKIVRALEEGKNVPTNFASVKVIDSNKEKQIQPSEQESALDMSKNNVSKIIGIVEKCPTIKQSVIAKVLQVSDATVSNIMKAYRAGEFEAILPDYSMVKVAQKAMTENLKHVKTLKEHKKQMQQKNKTNDNFASSFVAVAEENKEEVSTFSEPQKISVETKSNAITNAEKVVEPQMDYVQEAKVSEVNEFPITAVSLARRILAGEEVTITDTEMYHKVSKSLSALDAQMNIKTQIIYSISLK